MVLAIYQKIVHIYMHAIKFGAEDIQNNWKVKYSVLIISHACLAKDLSQSRCLHLVFILPNTVIVS